MTLLQIQYFMKVADCMSFSRAAEELFVAQPSVSRQVQLLEQELGFDLFDRTQRRAIHLTEAGMVFRDYFRRSQADFEQAKSTAAQLQGGQPLQLRVGVGQNWDLTWALRRFREQVELRYPRAQLQFENLPFLQLRQLLAAGKLDVIFCTRTSLENFEGLEVLEIGRAESRAYVRRGLLRPEDEPLQIRDFDGQTLLTLPEEEAPLALQIIQLQFYAHQVRVVPREVSNRDTIRQALLLGEGITVFDQYMWLGQDPRLTWLPMAETVPICMLWQHRNQNPLIHLLGDTMVEAFREKV